MRQKACCEMPVSTFYGIEVRSEYGLLQARAIGEGTNCRPSKLPFLTITILIRSAKSVIILGSEGRVIDLI